MNKILYLVLMILISFNLSAQLTPGTDVISVQNLSQGGITLSEEPLKEAVDYTSPTTGTPYAFTNLANVNGNMYFNMGLGFRNFESAGYIKSISVKEMSGVSLTFYAGNEPITTSPFMQSGVKTLNFDKETGTVTIDAPYTYIGVWTYEATVGSIEIEWSAEAPVVPASKPRIILNSELGCPAGSTLTIESDTQSAQIEVKITKGEDITTTTYPNPATVVLEGEVGDKLTVEARAIAEGYDPSDWVKRNYTITDPILAQPEFSLPSFSSVVTLGASVTLTNPNAEGSIMKYTVCDGEEKSTTESSVTLVAEGEIGAEWSISAYCEAEGWLESDKTEWEGTIATNVCPAPTFDPAEGEHPAGTQIKISATYPASSVTYRINGGEWETSTSLWNLSVTLNEDMTIEAYSSGMAPYVNSETVTAAFTIEKLGADCDEIKCSTFSEVAEATIESYKSATTSNGAEYSLLGRSMSDGLFINGEGYLKTDKSDKEISRIRVDARFGNAMVIYLSENPISERAADLTTIELTSENFGQWISMPSELNPRYFYLTTQETTLANCLDRVVVEYNVNSSVSEINLENGESAWYDLTGTRVENPTKGIYIRVLNGKATKILVK